MSKKYFDRTITRKEWEEVLWRLDRADEPGNIDQLFRSEWQRKDELHKIPRITWESMQRHWNSDQNQGGIVISHWKWAAAASILVLISAIWWVWGEDQNLITYETCFGETEQILLNDGTSVTLNANSRLIWDVEWEASGVRVANLDGEAYFDVSHIDLAQYGNQELLPFQVQTSELEVNVLGTAFNVSNRRGETNVFLERGLVRLVLADRKNDEKLMGVEKDRSETSGGISKDVVLMKPGDLVSFSSATNVLKKEDDKKNKNYLSWKNGTLTFGKMEFGKILIELEDIYGKQFEVEDKALLRRKVSLAVPYENWETVYKLIEVTLNLEIIEDSENNEIKIRKRTG